MATKSPRTSRSSRSRPQKADDAGTIRTAEPASLTGHFLIAMPGMGDPNFARGITFICQHNQDGAMGLVVNRLSDYRLGDVLQQMNMPCGRKSVASAPVLVGGPVQPERGFVLHAAGQLEQELRENAWLTVQADDHILFDTALDERWGAAVALVGVNPANLTSYSGRA